jgi:GNAT superfamily N-acetyltransferase
MPVIVAKEGRARGRLPDLGLARGVRGRAVVAAMLRAYPGAAPDAYVYGPVCVAEEARGRGLAGAMFAALRARLPGREGVLFIAATTPIRCGRTRRWACARSPVRARRRRDGGVGLRRMTATG